MPQLNVARRQPIAALWYSSLGGLLLSFFIVIIVIIFTVGGGSCAGTGCALFTPAVALVFATIVVLIVMIYPILYWYLLTYQLTGHNITVNSGILFRQYETIDFARIQTVDNERGPLLWIFGLTMLKVWTASADQVSFDLHGRRMESHPHPDTMLILDAADAELVKDHIMRGKAGVSGL